MSVPVWRTPKGWELLLRRARTDAELGAVPSLLVGCSIDDGDASYEYLQHWFDGQLATWELRGALPADVFVRRTVAAEEAVWTSSSPATAMADDRIRLPASNTWCTYPPTPAGFGSVERPVEDPAVTIRVRLLDSEIPTRELALFRAGDGSWSEWRGAPGQRLDLPDEQLDLGLDMYHWARLALGRCAIATILTNVELTGDTMMIGALQSGVATAANLAASTEVWPAVRWYEEYREIIRHLDTDELSLTV